MLTQRISIWEVLSKLHFEWSIKTLLVETVVPCTRPVLDPPEYFGSHQNNSIISCREDIPTSEKPTEFHEAVVSDRRG